MGEKQRLRAALDVERGACNRLMDTADELRAEVARLLRENEALQSSEAESRAEVERMWGNVKALEVAVDANLATIADLRAELARYDVPLADGESLRTVGGWRALSDAERERWEWTLTGERRYGRWYTGDPPRFSVDCILIVRERVPAAPPEPPKVKAGQWIRPSSSDVRYLVASVGASNVSLVGFDDDGEIQVCNIPHLSVASWPLCGPDPRWPAPPEPAPVLEPLQHHEAEVMADRLADWLIEVIPEHVHADDGIAFAATPLADAIRAAVREQDPEFMESLGLTNVWASLAHEGKSAAKAWVLSDACTHLDGEAE